MTSSMAGRKTEWTAWLFILEYVYQPEQTSCLLQTAIIVFIVLPYPVQLYLLLNNPKLKSMYRNDPNKYKKRLNISSLNAAICNVAVFKSMK